MDWISQHIVRKARGHDDVSWGSAKDGLYSLVCLCLLLLSVPALALDTQVRFRQYVAHSQALKSDDDGMPMDVVQDQAGFLWVGKTNGLVRYDGLERTHYSVADDADLNSNYVQRLYVDSDGRVIILTDSGVSALAENDLNLLALYETGQHMNTVLQLPGGEIVFGGNSGLHRITDGFFEPFLPALQGETILALRWFDDALWIGGVGQLWSLRSGNLREYKIPGALRQQSIRDLEIFESQLWLGTDTGLWVLVGNDLQPQAEVTQTTDIRTLLADRHGSLWFGGSEIAGRLLADGAVEFITFDDKESGVRAHIRAFLEDHDGNFWIARETGEVIGTRNSNASRISVNDGLPVARVNAITTTASGVPLIGHDLGVSAVDQGLAVPLLDAKVQKRSAGVNTVLHSSEQQLWVGTKSGLAIYSDDGTELTPERLRQVIDDPVLVLLEQKPGLVWIGTSAGLYKWEGNRLTSALQLQDRQIEAIHAGPDGRLWVGTNRGLFFRKDGEFFRADYSVVPAYAAIVGIASLPGDQIAAAVRDRGILVGRDGKWRLLSEDNGFTADSTFFLGNSPDGYLWGATSSGVYRVPAAMLTDHDVAEFPVRTILSTRSTYRPEIDVACCYGGNASAAAIHENMLYVLGNDGGVLLVNMRNPREELAVPVPYLQRMSQKSSGGWSSIKGDIELDEDERFLRLDYSAVQLMMGSNVRFRYRLGGEAATWIEVGRDTTAILSNLVPGKQLFELQASVRENEWSGSSRALWVTRRPSFVETIYFYLAVAAGLIAIYAAIVLIRARWLRNRVDHIEGLIHQRTADLRDVNENLNQANAMLTKVSHTDVLTGLHNRRYLEANKQVLGLPDIHIGEQNARTALVLLDIDFFKRINDEHSHTAGDAVLKQFADLLKSFVRVNDEVIRWGGEEFMMLLRYRDGQLPAILERICRSVRMHTFSSDTGVQLQVTVSVGAIASPTETLRGHAGRLDDLFQCADMALYSVKRNGRDGWACTAANDQQFQVAAKSRQMADDMLDLIEADILDWNSSRPEFRLDADNSVVQLALVRQQKEVSH